MLDLRKRAAAKGAAPDLRAYVKDLEQWIILTLAEFGVTGFLRDGRVGVWVSQSPVASHQSSVASEGEARGVVPPPAGGRLGGGRYEPPRVPTTHYAPPTTHEKKIAALGVRVQKWVTSHGIAINVDPDLSHYAGIVPCGIREFGVTSLAALGVDARMEDVHTVLTRTFGRVFR
jgi:lipoyl(octanoyl) transferase